MTEDNAVKTSSPKPLVTIVGHGIGSEVYTKGTLEVSSIPEHVYGKVVYLDFEEIFNSYEPWYVKYPAKLVKPADKFFDIYAFYMKKKARTKLRAYLRDEIFKWQKKGYTVNYWGHSLASIIGLTCGTYKEPVEINEFVALGSPVSLPRSFFVHYSISALVRSWVVGRIRFITSRYFKFVYSPMDHICNRYNKEIEDLLQPVSETSIEPIRLCGKHHWLDYVKGMAGYYLNGNKVDHTLCPEKTKRKWYNPLSWF